MSFFGGIASLGRKAGNSLKSNTVGGLVLDPGQDIIANLNKRHAFGKEGAHTLQAQQTKAARKDLEKAKASLKEKGYKGDELTQRIQNTSAYKNVESANAMENEIFADSVGGVASGVKDYLLARDFAGEGAGRTKALLARHGTIAAGAVGVGTAGRLLTGGNLTHNNRGERDIAGIPFI